MNKPKERPILFSGPMVRAILDGRKTQTRRVVKSLLGVGKVTEFDKSETLGWDYTFRDKRDRWNDLSLSQLVERCRHGKPGDRLWVREAFRLAPLGNGPRDEFGRPAVTHFRSTDSHLFPNVKWKPSIHMPRWASRITLEVTGARVERLNDISRGDAMAEGCPHSNLAYGQNPCDWFHELWESINGPESWAANPWVWVIEFRKTEKES
jgi:hypothetical protein